jgi:hypothetical protein
MSLFIVKVKQTSPPIYRVKIRIGVGLLQNFIELVATVATNQSLLLEKTLQSDDVAISDLGVTITLT